MLPPRLEVFPPKNLSYKAPPAASPNIPPAIPPIILPATGTTEPIAAPTAPKRPAPIALKAALPGLSPKATDNPKSINAPTTGSGILFRKGLTALSNPLLFPPIVILGFCLSGFLISKDPAAPPSVPVTLGPALNGLRISGLPNGLPPLVVGMGLPVRVRGGFAGFCAPGDFSFPGGFCFSPSVTIAPATIIVVAIKVLRFFDKSSNTF